MANTVKELSPIEYAGLDCMQWDNGMLSIIVTKSVGPRVIHLSIDDSPNIFAELPDITLNCPGKGDFHLYGGHRLWHAPENPARTYLPDDQPIDIEQVENRLVLKQEVEQETGLAKEIILEFTGQRSLSVTHKLTNHGLWQVVCAPWAITQLRSGGVALLPQNSSLTENNPMLPNRSITLWPYTKIASEHIEWGDDVIQVKADIQGEEALKIGFSNQVGWLSYWWENTLFIKTAEFDAGAEYFDFGSSSECYCNANFIELETLAPITTIQPGASVFHTENWHVLKDVSQPNTRHEIETYLKELA